MVVFIFHFINAKHFKVCLTLLVICNFYFVKALNLGQVLRLLLKRKLQGGLSRVWFVVPCSIKEQKMKMYDSGQKSCFHKIITDIIQLIQQKLMSSMLLLLGSIFWFMVL